MPKYQYDRLYVSSPKPRDFDPRDPLSLRRAVEYLKSVPQSPFVLLVAEISVQAGLFKVRAPATLKLEEVIGKTPRQVWDHLDSQIDDQIRYFKSRSGML